MRLEGVERLSKADGSFSQSYGSGFAKFFQIPVYEGTM
jgi:hypothetical protein